ncbi:hypothetical protein BT67DRAFT_253357 [Trichocladium antarcticum]|uniref:Dynamin family protein n=1 Tax=Trichocladium antarcticum TaxID=1450529 RepID=A0AAN6ZA47_9PEZI|nr:hypothetical protein BT67DRAFT_253357 [Trichocladium antarcticum]
MDCPSPTSSATADLSSASPASSLVALDADALVQLNSSDARTLLDSIDSLRELQVGEIVSLPQIIVVGDQSSGKSSVLEAISRVRFPVDGDLCTRFATELVLRRASQTAVDVRIQFADHHASSTSAASSAPQQPFRRSGFDRDDLPAIITEAKELMGISNGGAKKFSKDILRVEIAGPDIYPLTLVDLPGFFHTATADQNLQDKQTVDQLVEGYMAQPKSIILAVVAANNQLANQVVLHEASRHDPKRERTIGVITKPDLAGSASTNERKYLDLVKGRENMHKLALGWYVLRNRSEEERATEADERDTNEEHFFQTGAWRAISPPNRGVESLRKRLSKVLLDHIRTSLPDLIHEIEEGLRDRQERLDRLGRSRSNPDELRSYLLTIADDFQRLAHDAVEGRYNDKFFGTLDQQNIKLRAILRNLNSAFDATLSTKGSRWKIEWDRDSADSDDEASEGKFPDYLQSFIDLYEAADPEPITESDLNSHLQSVASANQGKEFPGMPNAELVLQLFRRQAERWQEIAQSHLDLTLKFTKAFVEQVFKHTIGPDEATAQAILVNCVDPFFDDKNEALQAKLQELLRPYTCGYGLPSAKEFHDRLSRRTIQRLADQLTDRLEKQHPALFQAKLGPGEGLNRAKVLQAVLGSEAPETSGFGTEKIIDMMVSYYEVSQMVPNWPARAETRRKIVGNSDSTHQMSLRTFIDNVINLAVESCLVCDVPTILTPRKVDGMSVDRLKELASESAEVEAERQMLREETDALREGLRRCQQHRPRASTVLPGGFFGGPSAAPSVPISRNAPPLPSPTPEKPIARLSAPVKTPNQGPTKLGTLPAAADPNAGGFASLAISSGNANIFAPTPGSSRNLFGVPTPSAQVDSAETTIDGGWSGRSAGFGSTTLANNSPSLFGPPKTGAQAKPLFGGLGSSPPNQTSPPATNPLGAQSRPLPFGFGGAPPPATNPFGSNVARANNNKSGTSGLFGGCNPP